MLHVVSLLELLTAVRPSLPPAWALQERYEAPRQAANGTMMAALEVLKRTFGAQGAGFGAARAAGLSLLDALPPVKNGIMRYAMGMPHASGG